MNKPRRTKPMELTIAEPLEQARLPKIIQDPVKNREAWRAMASSDIPVELKDRFLLTVKLVDKPYKHTFECSAENPMAAFNKYLHAIRTMQDIKPARVEKIEQLPFSGPYDEAKTRIRELYAL